MEAERIQPIRPSEPAPAPAPRPRSAEPAPPALAPLGPPAVRLGPAPAAPASAGGSPLPSRVQGALTQSFGLDLTAVRVHSDASAAAAADTFSARAFTYGSHIFLGSGERPTDLGLMAHEVAHTVQQRGAPAVQLSAPGQSDAYEREAQRATATVLSGERLTVRERVSSPRIQRLGIGDALDYFAERANVIPGFRMFTILLGLNPINMSRVERSAANVLRALVELIPGGALITQALDSHGIFDRVGGWVDEQLRTLGLTGSMIRRAIDEFLDSLSWTDIFDLSDVWNRARRIFTDPIDRIISFVKGLVRGIIDFIKDAILRPLARLAEGTRGYDLLKAVLGRDPITGEPVPQTPETLIGGFMKLIGQEEVWNNLKRANAVGRAWTWFRGALAGLLGYIRQIPSLFLSALQQLELADIVLVPRAFARIARVFGGFLGDFFSWAGQQVLSLLQIIFEVVAPAAMPYIRRAAGAFRQIIQNPVRFVGNLVRAGIQGFRQFAGNFLDHLRRSLVQWLTGTLSGANLYIPTALEPREIIRFVLSVLGLTWQNVRQKLARVVGEPAARALESGFDLVVTLVREGPAAAWERIRESISNLREMVMEQIMTFVRERIVQAAITRLLTSLNPVGAFIQAIIAIYNTIMFFVERLRQIAQVAASFVDSIAAIASGNVGTAASRVEQTMGGLLTLVISFLARIVGLGRVSDAVTNIVNRLRAPIDRALERVVEWIVTQARRLGRFIAQAGVPQDPNERLRLGLQAAVTAVDRFAGRRVGAAVLTPLLAAIRLRYGLASLDVVPDGTEWAVHGVVNPDRKVRTKAKVEGKDEDLLYRIDDRVGQIQVDSVQENRTLTLVASNERTEFAYVGNVPAIPKNDASKIADKYAKEGFAGGVKEAARRFSLVIGVNTFEDLRGRNLPKVRAWTTGFAGYPIGIISFVWRPFWKKGEMRATFEDAQAGLRGQDAAIEKAEASATNQAIIPYGAIRDLILNHPFTTDAIAALQQRSDHVYVHTGDPDAVSLRASEPGVAGVLNAATVGEALFERYDSLLKSRTDPDLGPPVIASGGYRLRLKPEGDLTAAGAQLLTALASELDIQIRQAMSRINPAFVYFPEPNTVLRVEGNNLQAVFSGGASEGDRMVRTLLKHGIATPARIAFDERVSIVTSGERIALRGVEGETSVTIGRLGALTADQIQALFELTQSHADFDVWQGRIRGTPAYRSVRQTDLADLVKLYWPHRKFGFDPATLKRELPRFDPNAEPDPPPLLRSWLGPDAAAQDQLIQVARQTGAAVKEFLLQLLSAGGAGPGGRR